MPADVQRDGQWAVSALKSAADYGSGSTSAGCTITTRDGEIVMNADFARLLAAWCIRTNERLHEAHQLLRQAGMEPQS